jgi:3-phenylpropionate/cinnamic acid dioxygenase small subunit
MSLQTLQEVTAFLWQEADLLDHKEHDAWLDLWEEAGRYIVPIDPGSTDYANTLNYANDDHAMRRMRVHRLRSGEAVSTTPAPRTARTTSRIVILKEEGDVIVVRAAQNLREFHKDRFRFYTSNIEYTLKRAGASFKIAQKIIRLLNSDDAIASIGYIL